MGRLKAAGILLFLIFTPPVLGRSQAVLVDQSGSMRPYLQSGLLRDLGHRIRDVLRQNGEIETFAFSVNVTPVPDFSALANMPPGAFTYLDRTIDFLIAEKYSIAWLVTDNVEQQAGSPEAGDTELFYRKLKSDAVKKISILPLLQPPGKTGLVIYAILLSDDAAEQYEKGIAGFLAATKGEYQTEALRMKPLDHETLDVVFVRGNLRPNRDIITYQVGQPIQENVEIKFKSKFEHLKIVDAKVTADQSMPEFGARSLLRPDKKVIQINPDKVLTLDPQGETEAIYHVNIDFGQVRLKKDLLSLWKAAWGKSSEDINFTLTLTIAVPQSNFQFRDSFITNYNATSPQLAQATGKIYRIDKLPLLLAEDSTAIVIRKALPFRVQYPWWPALLWIFLFAIAAGLLIAVVVIARRGISLFERTGKWKVAARTERGTLLTTTLDDKGLIRVQGDDAGVIVKNRFEAVNGVTVEGGTNTPRLEDQLELKIALKGRPIILQFSKAAADEKQEAAPHTPGKR